MAKYYKTFILCVIFLVNVDQSVMSASFLEEPEDAIVTVGNAVVLSCVVDTDLSPNSFYLYWYKARESTPRSGVAISKERTFFSEEYRNSRFSVAGTGYRFDLTIHNTEVSDSSYYYCRFVDPYVRESVYSRSARLDIYDQSLVPTCEISPSSQSLDVGDRITINCNPPSPGRDDQIQPYLAMWKGTNGARVPTVSNRVSGVLSYSFVLREQDVNKPYTCTSSSSSVTSSYPNIHNCTVTPISLPTVTLTPRRATATLGDTAVFTCVTTGTPSYNQFKWVIGYGRKNVLRLTASNGRYIVSSTGNSGSLAINNVEMSDNNTAVRCQATNVLEDKIGDAAVLYVTPSNQPFYPGLPSTTLIRNRLLPTPQSTVTKESEQLPPSKDGDAYGTSSNGSDRQSSGAVTGESVKDNSSRGAGGTVIAILISLLVLLVLIAIVVLYVRKRQGKPTPKLLKRLSVDKPLTLRKFSFKKPQFVQRISLSKGVQQAQDKIEVVHKRISTLKSQSADSDKRSSTIRESQIEVLVNPPPPDWQFRNVEDVDKLQRQRMIQRHAPSGAYSHKEMDLLNSLINGSVKVRTLEPTKEDGIAVMGSTDVEINGDDDDADSQFESDFEEDEFDDPMSDSGNRAIDPSPKAPPRRKRGKKQKKTGHVEKTEAKAVTTDSKDKSKAADDPVIYANSEVAVAVAADAKNVTAPAAVDTDVTMAEVTQPTYAIVNRSSKVTGKS